MGDVCLYGVASGVRGAQSARDRRSSRAKVEEGRHKQRRSMSAALVLRCRAAAAAMAAATVLPPP